MNFDVTVTHEPRCTRVRVEGQGGAGRVLSLLQVLAVDSANWPTRAVLLDVRDLQPPLRGDEQMRIAEAAADAFARRRVAILAAPGSMRDDCPSCAFEDEAAAQAWLTCA